MKMSLIFVLLSLFSMLHLVHCVDKSPHIVFIVADDLGWNDVGWHNSEMITPNLNRLAKAGVILNSSYVQPLCTPSRNCFLAGYYPFHTGLQHNVISPLKAQALPENITTLPQKLKQLGYVTHMVGKWHLGHCNWKYTPTYRGFDSFMGFYNGWEDYYNHSAGGGYDFRFNTTVYHREKGLYSANVFANRAIDIINSTDPQNDKLFLYLPFQSVHQPIEVPTKYEDMYPNIQHKERRTYCGMVSALDEAVGNITNALTQRGFMNNTVIIFTTDNGGPIFWAANNLPLRGSKMTLWEGGTRGAAFVYSPTLLDKKEYVNNEMIHAVDWFPTILTVAGGSPDPSLDGVNQWDTISKNQVSRRSEFVYQIDELIPNAAIRVGDYKLIVGSPGNYNDWYPVPDFSDDMDQHNRFLTSRSSVQLFNIKDDPTEHFDISGQHVDIVHKMQQRLEEYKKTLIPAQNPPDDPRSDPKYHGGNWSPGWC